MDTVQAILDFNAGRDPERLAMKYQAMRASPCLTLEMTLRKLGHAVTAVTDGHAALEAAADRAGVGRGARAAHQQGFGFAHRKAHARTFGSIPAIRRKLASISWPCSVAMLSGWNCTEWIGRLSWRKPMTLR